MMSPPPETQTICAASAATLTSDKLSDQLRISDSIVKEDSTMRWIWGYTEQPRAWIEGYLDRCFDNDCEEALQNRLGVHMFAGSAAGIAEHCVMLPVDACKTRIMQAFNVPAGGQYTKLVGTFSSMLKQEGFVRMWRGLPSVFLGAGVAHGCYFATYERGKQLFGATNPLVHIGSGAAAAIVHDLVMTPTDAVKQRMQKYQSTYTGNWDCVKTMLRTEGWRSFYRPFGTQICMNVPQQAIQFCVYERLKERVNPNRSYEFLLIGGVAGGIAGWCTTPLDVCKTLLNTQHVVSNRPNDIVRGTVNGIKTIYGAGGIRTLYKGAITRTFHIGCSTAICWTVYERVKSSLL